MKKIVLVLAVVLLFLSPLIGCTVFAPKPAPTSTSEAASEAAFVYQEQMADGTTWYAYGKGSIFDRDPRPDDMLFLTNAKGETFKVKVVQVFQVPPQSRTKGVWLEFENLTPARGQPLTGPGFVVVHK
jgi:hypothetical protein